MTTDHANLRALLAAAIPGPWRVGRQDGAPRDHLVDMGDPPKAPYFRMHKGIPKSDIMRGAPAFGIVESDDEPAEKIAATAALIVAAVNALPALLDEADANAREIAKLRRALHGAPIMDVYARPDREGGVAPRRILGIPAPPTKLGGE